MLYRLPSRTALSRQATLICGVSALALAACMTATPVRAQTVWTGNVSDDWTDAGNWSAGVPDGSIGAVIDSVVGAPNLAGPGEAHHVIVGALGDGALTVSSGGALYTGGAEIAQAAGTVTVSGPGAGWENSGHLLIGAAGAGRLDILDGGVVVNFSHAYLGLGGGRGSVTIDGTNSVLDVQEQFHIANQGEVTVSNGGRLMTRRGGLVQSDAEVSVTGSSSIWSDSALIAIGHSGTGTVSVSDGGTIAAPLIHLGGGGHGNLIIGAGGTLLAGQVTEAPGGTSAVTFDGGRLVMAGGQGNLFSNMEDGDVILEDGGGTINTNGWDGGTAVGLVGSGGLTKTGAGMFVLSGANTYEGATVVEQGELRAGSTNAFSQQSTLETVHGSAVRLNGFDQAIGGLSGDGEVDLGSAHLSIGHNGASTSFSGAIYGAGAIEKVGTGTLILTGNNIHSGGTTVTGGTLQIGDATTAGTLVGRVDVGADGVLDIVNAAHTSSIVSDGITRFSGTGDAIGIGIENRAGATLDFSGTTGTNGHNRVSAAGISGAGNIELGANRLTLGSNNVDAEIGGVISGNGSIEKVGYGNLTLTGESTYSGGTTVSDGYITLGVDGGASGSIQGPVTVNYPGNLNFVNTDTTGITEINNSGNVAFFHEMNAGDLSVINHGPASNVFFNDDTDAGNISILNGYTQFQGTSSAGNATIVDDWGHVRFQGNADAGNADITINYSASMDFLNNATAGNATIMNGRGVTFYQNSSAANATIQNNGGINFRGNADGGNATITGPGDISFSQTTGANGDGKVSLGSLHGSGWLELGTNELTLGGNNSSTEFSGYVDLGTLVKTGTGRWTMSGWSTATAMTVADGTLQLGTETTEARVEGALNVSSGGTLDLANVDTADLASITNDNYTLVRGNVDAGSASITNNHALRFTEQSSAGNATIANNYQASFVDDSSAGNASIVTANGADLMFLENATAGTATLTNHGYLDFDGFSTADHATIDNSGRLSFWDFGSAGSADITNGSEINFYAASAANSTIENAGQVNFRFTATAADAVIENRNSLIFSEGSTAGRAEIANDGSLVFEGQSIAGSAEIANDGVLIFKDQSTAAEARINGISSLIGFMGESSAGNAEIFSSSTLLFQADSTAENATIINTGTMQFLDSSTADNATLIAEGTGRTEFMSNSSGGTARLVANGTGSIDFSQQTGVDATAGSIEGTGGIYLGDKTFTVGSNNRSTTFSGTIADGGTGAGTGVSLVKVGTGTLTLAGTNSYTGTTRILGGLLNITGTLSSALEITSGGRVGGNGTLGTVNVGSGGIVAPGNSIGAVTIGTLTIGAGAIYEVELIAGGNTPGVHSDLINVTGTATLNAGVGIRVLAENRTDTGRTYARPLSYTVLTTGAPGGLIVNAAPTVSDDFAFLNFTGSHDGQNFYLTSAPAVTTFCLPGASTNQCSTGRAVYALGDGNAVFEEALYLGDSEVAGALDSLSGEVHASAQAVIDETFAQLGQMLAARATTGLVANANGDALSYAVGPASAGVVAIADATALAAASAWLTPLAGHGVIKSDGNAAELEWWSGGLAGGYEASANGMLAGLAFSYQRGAGTVVARQSSSTIDSFALATYGAWSDGATALAGALTLGANHVSTDRGFAIGGASGTAMANYWTQAIGLSAEATHDFDLGNGMTLSPLATLALGWSGHGGFAETGAGAFDLTGAASSFFGLDAGLGFGLSHVILTETGTVTLEGRAAWEHAFAGAAAAQTLTFAGGTTPFTTEAPAAGADRLRLGAGVTFETDNGLMVNAAYDGSFTASQQVHQASATLRRAF